MRIRVALVAAELLAFSAIGVAQKVRTDWDHDADFSKFQTFRVVKISDDPAISQLAEQRITGALVDELTKKGLRKVETGGDLLVGFQASVEEQKQYTTFSDGFGPGWGYGARWGGYGSTMSTTTSSSIPVGALTIDMMDPARKQLVFRATATDTLSDKPQKNAEKIKKAMRKIFDKYPPKAKG